MRIIIIPVIFSVVACILLILFETIYPIFILLGLSFMITFIYERINGVYLNSFFVVLRAEGFKSTLIMYSHLCISLLSFIAAFIVMTKV